MEYTKTVVALNIADGLIKNGNKVALFEMEMTEEALGMRRLAYTTLIDNEKIKKGNLTDEEWGRITNKFGQFSKNNRMFTDCSPSNSIYDIQAKVKMLKQTVGVDVIIIDHLTLLKMDDRKRRDLAVGEVTRQSKIMAKELDISVILLSQLSRANEQRQDKRPMLSDLRDSGDIEADADMVMFIHRESYYEPTEDNQNLMEWKIAKNRNGIVGTIQMNYKAEYQLVTDMDNMH